MLPFIGSLFCIHAVASLKSHRRKAKTPAIRDAKHLRLLLEPVNKVARLLYTRRHEDEFYAAWEEIHQFVASVLFSLGLIRECVRITLHPQLP